MAKHSVIAFLVLVACAQPAPQTREPTEEEPLAWFSSETADPITDKVDLSVLAVARVESGENAILLSVGCREGEIRVSLSSDRYLRTERDGYGDVTSIRYRLDSLPGVEESWSAGDQVAWPTRKRLRPWLDTLAQADHILLEIATLSDGRQLAHFTGRGLADGLVKVDSACAAGS